MTRKAERDNKGEGERKKKKEQGATRGSPVVASIPWTSSSCTTMCPRAQEGQAAWGGGGRQQQEETVALLLGLETAR